MGWTNYSSKYELRRTIRHFLFTGSALQ